MSNQSRQRRRNLQWRVHKQMNNRRRLNIFLMEKRLSYLEGREEVICLDLENQQDVIKQLEIKVHKLLDDNNRLKAQILMFRRLTRKLNEPLPLHKRFGHWLRKVLCSKGNS